MVDTSAVVLSRMDVFDPCRPQQTPIFPPSVAWHTSSCPHHLLLTGASQQGHLFILEPAHHSHFIIHHVFSLSGPNNLALSPSMNTCCLTYAFLSTSLLPTNASQQGCLVILEPVHHSHRLRLYHDHRVDSPDISTGLTHSHLPNQRVRERKRC